MSDQAVEDRSLTGRRYAGEQPSLGRLNASVGVPKSGHWLRRLFAFAGPGYLISVGYMDPGNWATDISGGSKFGYTLLFVIALSNVMAIVLQALAVRLGIATDRDLAQACRAHYSKPVNIALWARLRGRDHRLRPRRSDRHGNRAQSLVPHPAGAWRDHNRRSTRSSSSS